jgi:cell wall-associated NlpC family hydrolase
MKTSRPLLVLTTVVALLGPALPALADNHQPTPSELRAAQQKVSAARRKVASLQARAELAAEQYNGALVRQHHLTAVSAFQAQLAAQAQAAYQASLVIATQAQAAATAAAAQADLARAAQRQAQAVADAAQLKLDRIAVGAFQTDGQLGMVSQLFLANDPLELANGRNVMNRISVYQDNVIAEAARARNVALIAAQQAAAAEQTASATAVAAATALARTKSTRDAAVHGRQVAAAAAGNAVQAARAAARAKAYALVLVGQAEALLHTAVRTAKQLQAEADQARQDAAGLDDGSAPSQAARTAIHWAFEEIGVPYSWGGGDENGPTYGFAQGAGTKGFDCSGLTLFSYAQAGIHLDHYTGSQWNEGKRIARRADLEPGDLMFFAYDTSDSNTIHHVAIYIGKGKMIEAPYTGEVVRVSSADRPDFIGATRPWS